MVTVAAASDSAWRKDQGGDLRAAVHLAGLLAEAPKDRSADYLCGAKDHPGLASFDQAKANAALETELSRTSDQSLTLQAVAALSAVGLGSRGEILRAGGLNALLTAFRNLGAPEELVVATEIAATRTREPITLMVPLIWLAAASSKERVCDCAVPPLVKVGDVPFCAFDKHTRLGREAIWRFAGENESVRSCLKRFIPASKRRSAAYVAAFYVDAAPVSRRLIWDQSDTLEVFGIERDLLHAGVAAEGINPLLEVMRANLAHLNELRANILVRSQSLQAAAMENHAGVP
jgi:hypothetical protein